MNMPLSCHDLQDFLQINQILISWHRLALRFYKYTFGLLWIPHIFQLMPEMMYGLLGTYPMLQMSKWKNKKPQIRTSQN